MSQIHVFSQSSKDGRASRGPVLSLQRLHPKVSFGEILERQSCASSMFAGPHLYFLISLKGYTCFLVCSERWVYCWKSLKKAVFSSEATESDAADVVDGAGVQLPACPPTLLGTLTYLAVSEHLTNIHSTGTTLWALPYVHFWDSPTRHSTFPPHSSN